MNTININYAKTCLPLSITRGNVEQRMQKARLFNLKFYDELQSCIKDDKIAPKTFARMLQKVAGHKFGIDILPAQDKSKSQMNYSLSYTPKKTEHKGYILTLPMVFYNEKIHKSYAPIFLKVTQNLFNELFNPKIHSRFMALFKKGYNIKSIMEFYESNLTKQETLIPENLEKFLEGKSAQEKIDSLHFLRYKLMSEKNTAQASSGIDKRIERHNNLQYIRPEGFYSLDKYKYDEKISILNDKLAEIIQNERRFI